MSYNKEILNPIIYNKKRKIVPQEKIQDTALKMTQKLAKLNFRDTAFLSNATQDEKIKIMALSMYIKSDAFTPPILSLKTIETKIL